MKHFKYIVLLLLIYVSTPRFSAIDLLAWVSHNYLVDIVKTGDDKANAYYHPSSKTHSVWGFVLSIIPDVKLHNKTFATLEEEFIDFVSKHLHEKFHTSSFYLICFLFVAAKLAYARKPKSFNETLLFPRSARYLE